MATINFNNAPINFKTPYAKKERERGVLGDGNFDIEDIGAGAGYIGGNVLSGVLGFVENVGDAIGGTVSRIFGDEEGAKRIYENSWSGAAREGLVGGIKVDGEGWQTVGDIAYSVGDQGARLAVAVGLAALTGGASTGMLAGGAGKSVASSILKQGLMSKGSMALLGLSAYGGGMSEAVQKTGSLGFKEDLYGIGSALLELGTEQIFGFADGLTGGVMDNAVGKIIRNKTVKGLIGEGVEEMISEGFNPLLQRATIDENAKGATLGEVLKAGIMGAAVSGVIGGGQTAVSRYNSERVGKQILSNSSEGTSLEDVLVEGEKLNLPLANTLRIYEREGGKKPSANQVGRLVRDINTKKSELAVEKIKAKYNTSERKAKAKYVDELALEIVNQQTNGRLFAKDDVSASAVKTFSDRGGNLLDVDRAHRIAGMSAKSVRYEFDENKHNAWTENGKDVVINLASKKLPTINATHEVVHTMDKSEVKKLYEDIMATDKNFAKSVVSEYQNHPSANEYTEDMLAEEVVARFMEGAVTDHEKLIKQVEGSVSLGERIVGFFKGLKSQKENIPKSQRAELNRIYNRYVDALSLARAKGEIAKEKGESKTDKAARKNSTERVESLQYDLADIDDFDKQVDRVNDDVYEKSHLMVRKNTPKLLIEVGLEDKPMLITATHTKTAMGVKVKGKNTHNLSVETLKNLPKLLETPAIIMDSAKAETNSIVMFVNAKDVEGSPVLCAVKVDGKGNFNDIEITANVITSVYGKEVNPTGFIRKAVNENRVLYWNKKMSQELFNTPGLQLPDNINSLDSNIIIRKTSAKVNTETKKSEETVKRQYSLTEDYATQVGKALRGELGKNTDVLVSKNTPKILLDLGLDNLPMLVTQKHLRNINKAEDGIHSEYHGIEKTKILKLPRLLSSPVIVMDSISDTGKEKSIVVVTSELDNKKRPIIVAIKVDGKGRFSELEIDSNFIKSFYGKDGFKSFLEKHMKADLLLFIDKEKSHKLFRELQVQFPQTLNKYDFNTIIRKTSAKVNTETKKSDEKQYSLKDIDNEEMDRYNDDERCYTEKMRGIDKENGRKRRYFNNSKGIQWENMYNSFGRGSKVSVSTKGTQGIAKIETDKRNRRAEFKEVTKLFYGENEDRIVQRNKELYGLKTRFFIGNTNVNGIISERLGFMFNDTLFLSFENDKEFMLKLSEHEAFHYLFRADKEKQTQLISAIKRNLGEEYYSEITKEYLDIGYQKSAIDEEVACDIYAGLTSFGYDSFSEIESAFEVFFKNKKTTGVQYSLTSSPYNDKHTERVYLKKDVKATVNAMLEMALSESEYDGDIKSVEQVIEALYLEMNSLAPDDLAGRERIAREVSQQVINSALLVNSMLAEERKNSRKEISLMKNYRGMFNLKGIEREIEYEHDKKKGQRIKKLWGGGTLDIFDIIKELEGNGIVITESINSADAFLDFIEKYESAYHTIRDVAKEELQTVFSQKERSEMKALMTEEVMKAFKNSKQEYYRKKYEDDLARINETKSEYEKRYKEKVSENELNTLVLKEDLKKKYKEKYKDKVLENKSNMLVFKSELKEKYKDKVLENKSNMLVFKSELKKKSEDFIRKFSQKERALRKMIKEKEEVGRLKLLISKTVDKAKEFKKRKYASASAIGSQEFLAIVDTFSKVVQRRNINVPNVIEFLKIARAEYTVERLGAEYRDLMRAEIDNLADSVVLGKSLNSAELASLSKIGSGLIHVFSTYDTMYKDGKRTEIMAAGKDFQDKFDAIPKVNDHAHILFMKEISDPRSVFLNLVGYNEENPIISLFDDVAGGETKRDVIFEKLMRPIDDFVRKNKYMKVLEKDSVNIGGRAVVKKFAIWLYMTSKRAASKDQLFNSGFSISEKESVGKVVKEKYTINEHEAAALYEKFTETDKKFIAILEDAFLKARELKIETDMLLNGFTNVSEGYYFPKYTDRDALSSSLISQKEFDKSLNSSVNNLSMNKSLRENAKQPLEAVDVMSVVETHMRQVSLYNGLAVPLDNFNKFWNKNLTGDARNVVSPKSIIKEKYSWAQEYVAKLFRDVQGIGRPKTLWQRIIAKIRSFFTVSALGANLKVFVTQFASYPMAAIYIEPKYLLKALSTSIPKSKIYEHSPFLKNRSESLALVKAEGVMDKIGKAGEFFMKPITKVDEFTVNSIFKAAALKTAHDNGLELLSDENLGRAAILAERTVRDTQPMYNQMERTGMMRSESEFAKALSMFTSAPAKQLSSMYKAYGKYRYVSAMYKEGKATKAELDAARNALIRTTASTLTSAIMFSVISLVMLNLLGRRDDEEEWMNAFFKNFGGALAGMFPLFRDVYGYFVNGFETENFLNDTANNLLYATKALFDTSSKVIGGEEVTEKDIVSAMNKVLRAGGQLTGLPVMNIKRQLEGIYKKYINPKSEKKQAKPLNFQNAPLNFKGKKKGTQKFDFQNAPLKFE